MGIRKFSSLIHIKSTKTSKILSMLHNINHLIQKENTNTELFTKFATESNLL
jgi:hypothetical protein